MSKKFKIIVFVILIILAGYLREKTFLNINIALHELYYSTGDRSHTDASFSFLYLFSYNQLYISKWFVTPFFAFIYWILQKQFLWLLFQEKKTNRWLGIMYLSLLLLAGISYCAGWATGHMDTGYRFSRIFMGLLQSPAPCMILIPVSYFYKQTQT